MTSNPRPRDIAWTHWQMLNDGRVEESLEVLDDDGTWWNLDHTNGIPMKEFKGLIRRALGVVQITFSVVSVLEEGDRVLYELESHADLPNGGVYENKYCFLCTVRNGKVLHVREYYDSKLLDGLLTALAEQRARSAAG